MSKKTREKKKQRAKKLAQRKHKLGSVVNYHNIATHIRSGRLAARGTVTGNLAMDLLEETDGQRITQANIDSLIDSWENTIHLLKEGTTDREEHSRFSENTFLFKQLVEIISQECSPDNLEEEMSFRIQLSLMRDNLAKMERIIVEFYNKIIEGKEKLYFVDSLEFNQSKAAREFGEYLPIILNYVDVGLFQKGCRLTLKKLSDRHYLGENAKYYRFREAHEIFTKRKK